MTDETYDVVVIGGGAAGLSGALTLARARRSVLVIDSGEPRNAPAAGVHAFLTRDGTSPADLTAMGRAEIESYGARVEPGRVGSVKRDEDRFVVAIDGGATVAARRLLITTGLVDELPDVAGLRERWGRDVIHCPYCHGWEIRDQAIGVLGGQPLAVHGALMLRQWTDDVTLFLHTGTPLTDDEWEQLAARGISVVDGEVESLVITDDELTGVRLSSGTTVARTALMVAPRFAARAEFLHDLGIEVTEHPIGLGTYVEVDATGLSTVPGVWLAGNVADPMAQVINAAAAGNRAGAMINADLMAEDTRLAVARRRAQAASPA